MAFLSMNNSPDSVLLRSGNTTFLFIKDWNEVHKIDLVMCGDHSGLYPVFDFSKAGLITKMRLLGKKNSNGTYDGVIHVYTGVNAVDNRFRLIINNRYLYTYTLKWVPLPWTKVSEDAEAIPDGYVLHLEHTFKFSSKYDGPDTWPLT